MLKAARGKVDEWVRYLNKWDRRMRTGRGRANGNPECKCIAVTLAFVCGLTTYCFVRVFVIFLELLHAQPDPDVKQLALMALRSYESEVGRRRERTMNTKWK